MISVRARLQFILLNEPIVELNWDKQVANVRDVFAPKLNPNIQFS